MPTHLFYIWELWVDSCCSRRWADCASLIKTQAALFAFPSLQQENTPTCQAKRWRNSHCCVRKITNTTNASWSQIRLGITIKVDLYFLGFRITDEGAGSACRSCQGPSSAEFACFPSVCLFSYFYFFPQKHSYVGWLETESPLGASSESSKPLDGLETCLGWIPLCTLGQAPADPVRYKVG